MTVNKKIRIALIGLNAPPEGAPTGTNWAASGHLPYILASDKYELVALQNSSIERASEAIRTFGLDPDKVKAYGSPESVANDPDIDLAVCCIRVDRHAKSLIPIIKAGKDVFSEWPLEASSAKAKDLADLVKIHGNRHIVGLQGRYNPVIRRLKEIITRGDIGKLESSVLVGHAFGGTALPSALDYFTDKKIGGNQFSIVFPHSMEFVQELLGEITRYRSFLVNQYPTTTIVDPSSGKVVDPAKPNNVPNQIILNAELSSGTVLTYKLHGDISFSPEAKPVLDTPKIPSMDWRIFGSLGQIHITSYDTMLNTWSLNYGTDLLKIEIYNAKTGTLTDLGLVEDEWAELPVKAVNMARLYEDFAAARSGEDVWYPDFDYAVKKHELIDAMYKENGMD